jgi:hypothetical protein
MTSASNPQAARDGSRLSRRDWTIIICGALVLVASFLPWEAASASTLGGTYTSSAAAWNVGFAAWFGSLLCAAAAAAVAARQLGYAVGLRGIGPNVIAGGLAVAGLALVVIRVLTLPRSGGYGPLGGSAGGYGPSFGAFGGVALAAVEAVVALLNFRASGERLPSFAAPGQPGRHPGHGQPRQAPGYSYPPQRPGYAQPTQPPEYSQPGHAQQPAPEASSPSPATEPRSSAAQAYGDQELAQRLTRLEDLRARQMISDAEYTEQRRRIISQL